MQWDGEYRLLQHLVVPERDQQLWDAVAVLSRQLNEEASGCSMNSAKNSGRFSHVGSLQDPAAFGLGSIPCRGEPS